MEKVHIICNPNAGRQIIQKNVHSLATFLEEHDRKVTLSYTEKKFQAEDIAFNSCNKEEELIIAVGGDGTVNEVINGIMRSTHRPKLAIYPAGTVNDFGNYLKIPRSFTDFHNMIIRNRTMKIDIGYTGNRYFFNVAAAGLLPEVAHTVSSEAKTVLGKFAYYIKGLREFPRLIFEPIPIRFIHHGKSEEKEILFFIVANSPSVGGFKNVAPEAKVDDGYLDLLIVENKDFFEVASIFLKAFTGNHINHPGLRYLQVEEFIIESDKKIDLDIDGELGGQLPASFSVKKQALEMIVP